MSDEILTLQQAARIMQVHENTVYRWITKLGFPAFRTGRVYRIKRTDLDTWLTSRKEVK